MSGKISEVVVVSITRETFVASRVGFGTSLMLVETTAFVDRVKVFTDVSDLSDDNIGDEELIGLAASAHMTQAYRPEQFKLGRKGKANVNCKQRVILDAAASAGTFTIAISGQVTSALNWDDMTTANKANIETAIEALSNVAASSVTVTVVTDYKDFYIEFDGDNVNTAFEKAVIDVTSLATTASYNTVFSHQFAISAATASGGTFTITVNGVTSTAINYDAIQTSTQTKIEEALKGMSNIYADGVNVVVETANDTFYIEFTGSNYGMTVSSISASGTNLTGAGSPYSFVVVSSQQGQESETWSGAYDLAVAADKDWFALTTPGLRTNGNLADQAALAAKVEAEDAKIYGLNTADPKVIADTYSASSPDDICETLKALAREKTFTVYSGKTDEFTAEAILGRQLSLTPGSSSYILQNLSGITVDDLSTTAKTYLRSKNCNFYQTMGGKGYFFDGVVAEGEFIDTIVGIDFMKTRAGEDIFSLLASAEKIPYDETGLAAIEGTLRSSLQTYGVGSNILVDGSVSVTVPSIDNVAAADKANRILRNVKFGGTLKGAVHKVYVDGKVSV